MNASAFIKHGDSLEWLPRLEAESIDSIVTDPPYELGFMGKKWDGTGIAYNVDLWSECLRVLKPGGHLLAFGGSRTWHRMASAIEDAGFEMRDSIAWLYGSGFPKSHNLKDEWQGWATALKPAFEPVVVARKPFKGMVAANVQAYGTGALNIDATRVAGDNPSIGRRKGATNHLSTRPAREAEAEGKMESRQSAESFSRDRPGELLGRWPTNVVIDEHTVEVLGEPSKFFPTFKYQAKAPTKERPKVDGVSHPTVKPVDLMRWLVKLVTPPGGVVLDPFAGSGTTVEACLLEGMTCIAIEREADYLPLIQERIDRVAALTLNEGNKDG